MQAETVPSFQATRTATPAEPSTGDHRRVAGSSFLRDVLAGLSTTPKTLPCKYLYDTVGSALFDRICELEAYYPTRTERALLARRAGEIAAEVGPRVLVVEPGAGSGEKARALLAALSFPAAYVPVDVSPAFLAAVTARLSASLPHVRVVPRCADFTQCLPVPGGIPHERRLVFFPGSTLGNFEEPDAVALLRRFRTCAGPAGRVLVGIDLVKAPAVLERAYNDPQGVTAAFNRNLLARICRELGARLPVTAFVHRARYDSPRQRIELSLVAQQPMTTAIGDRTFAFDRGEPIVTEYSHKYTLDGFPALARRAGLSVLRCWTDPQGYMALVLLAPVARP